MKEYENLDAMNGFFMEWLWKAPVGLALIGFGISVTAEGAVAKAKSAPFRRWFFTGTLGLIILNSGVSIFGDAVKLRTHYELLRQRRTISD